MAPIVTTSRTKKHSKIGIVYTLATIVVLAIGILFVLQKNTSLEVKTEVEQPKEITKSLEPPAKPKNLEVNSMEEKPLEANELEKKPTSSSELTKKPGQMTLPDGRIFTFPTPEPGKPRIVIVDGKTYECDHEGNFKDVTPRQLFSTAFEANFMGLAIENGSFIPAFLIGLDQDEVVKILKKDYQMIGDETDEEIKKIEAYLEMKGLALDYIENGGTFDDFVVEIASFVKAERVVRAQGLKQVMGLVKEGKIAEAKALADQLNDSISKEGYKPLNIPPHVRKAFDELDAANDDN